MVHFPYDAMSKEQIPLIQPNLDVIDAVMLA